MAGGYICKKFEWDGGRTDARAERCAFVLKGCAQALLDTNTGWALDTAKNATLDDYIQASGDKLYESNSYVNSPCYMLFFTSTSGAKLMLGYRYGYSRGTSTSYHGAISENDTVGKFQAYGLFASIIPPGSSSSFSTSSPFISGDASPIAFTATYAAFGSFASYNHYSFAFDNASNVTFRYFFITNGTNLVVLNNSNKDSDNQNKYNGFVCGRIFSTLFNPDDDTKKCGVFYLSRYYGGSSSSSSNLYESKIYTTSGHEGINLETSYFGTNYLSSSKFDVVNNYRAYQKADGTWENGMFSTNAGNEFHGETIASNTSQLGENVSTKRWVPCYMYGLATPETIAEHEIVAGCGNTLKGYIDPDLARIVNNNSRYARGTTFDNGNLIYLGGGLAVGWDASNTTSIF